MVGHEVNHHLQPCSMRALHKRLKFLHSVRNVHRQVGVDIVIVLNGVRRTCLPLNDYGIVFSNAEIRITGLCGVLQKSGVPNMCITRFVNTL